MDKLPVGFVYSGVREVEGNKSHLNDKICRVCGAKAVSFNYNGLACESCKTFFRRNAFRPNKFICYAKNNCELNRITRKKCKRCRMDRCFAIGMKKELIWKSKYAPKVLNFTEENAIIYKTLQNNRNLSLNPIELESLQEIAHALESFPEEISLKCIGVVARGRDFLEYPKLYITKFIKYCKCLPSFTLLDANDQLALLKNAFVQTLHIRFAFYYNPVTNQYPAMADEEGNKAIVMDNNLLFNRRNCNPNETVRIIKFYQTMNLLIENDKNVRNLLIVHFLFDNRNTEVLHKPEFIRHQYYYFCTLLLRYYEHKHQCMIVARQKYFALMTALQAMDYQIQMVRELFESNNELTKRDLVHKEIFDL